MLRRASQALVLGALLIMAIMVGVMTTKHPIKPLTEADVESIKLGFKDFLTVQVEKKTERKVEDVNINAIYQRPDGQVMIDYALVYNEKIVGGENVTYEISALAAMENTGENQWAITGVTNNSQAVEFLEGSVVTK